MRKFSLLLICLVAIVSFSQCQVRGMKKTVRKAANSALSARRPYSAQVGTLWVDSVMSNLSLSQKVAQLMVVRVPLDMSEREQHKFENLLRDTEVGGVCFFVGTARSTLPLIKRFQSISSVPLLVCIDAEWGLGMRLKDCYAFPQNAVFGQLPHEMDTLLFDMGREIGMQCKRMGIHVNFAPVVDVNSNPDNPVIGPRSFSADPKRVAELGVQYMKGLQSAGVIAVAKHFPGHGDTKTDSHFDLPIINHTREYMDTVDLYPFQRLIDEGVEGVMTAHLQVNAYEKEPNHPSSLSSHLVSELLRQRMKFSGLVITDGLDMQGVTKYYQKGQGELAALLAGSDILLLPPDVPKAIKCICKAAKDDPELQRLIDMRCRRVLRAKYEHGCAQLRPETWRVPNRQDSLRCDAIVRSLRLATDGVIDSIVNDGIAKHAFPGCQVLAMKDGRLLYRKAFGHMTYDTASPAVTMNTVYDLASVTKMVSTTLAVMKLVETGKVRLDDPLSRYLPYLKETDKAKITIRQVLSHTARLKSFDAFWKEAQNAEEPRESVISQVVATPLNSYGGYEYSDLGFILLGEMVQYVSGQRLDIFVDQHFYSPMGLCHTHFNPIEHGIDCANIAPTELDNHYRNRLVQGVVHDENAYAMGGVSGHAGLFSTADDLARILQMLLDGGTYDGRRYLKSETINLFNKRYYEKNGCRRGLGFDKPLLKGSGGSACDEASQKSYGHTGFTGNIVWVDPECGMVYIFLSNRVYPKPSPNRLASMNIRTQIQTLLYKGITQPLLLQADGVARFGN